MLQEGASQRVISADAGVVLNGISPITFLFAGLQGSGKTTTVAKVASYLKNDSNNAQNIDVVNDFNDVLRIHLGEEKTKTVLNNFYPYILFKTMLGNKLTPPQNIDISIAIPTINYPDFIKVKINLKTS